MTLHWTTNPADIPPHHARTAYRDLHARYIRPARATGAQRRTLKPPAGPLFEWLATQPGVAVTGVTVSAATLADVYGYLAEPAHRLGVALTIVADRDLDEITEQQATEPRVGYAWSLQRLRYLRARPQPPAPRAAAPANSSLDASQLAAVSAHDGVVQIIAPAGSGKTTVLIARAAELVARGAAPARILCTTFNTDAKRELQERLRAAGLQTVRAQTFHSVGHGILRECGDLRAGVRTLSLAQWRRLCAVASKADAGNEWIEPPLARGMVSQIKLGRLLTAREYRREAPADATGQTLATIYELYERDLQEQNVNDFDDLIFLSLRRLQRDAPLRERWQQRFDHVLVDEYQDIDPAQETLVQILAAPQDGLFAVGDEDQTLYAWRSASVERIVGLDGLYPGLQRVALDHNYRCPPDVVACSRQIIENNRSRFPKTILPAQARTLPDDPRPVIHREYATLDAAAVDVARRLSRSARGQIVVLARTSRVLRICAVACVPLDVKISAPDNVFEPAGARAALESYCRLLGDVTAADPDDVATVFRHPGRGLPLGAEQPLARMLAEGMTFAQGVAGLRDVPAHARRRLADGAQILDAALALRGDAPRCIRFLRRSGGLDEHFEQVEELTGGVEKVEIEVLEDALTAAAGMSVATYALQLARQSDALRGIRDEQHGLELTTVHRAKGRQWPTVIVFGCDEEQMPHKRALEDLLAGNRDALEAERRVAYVAFTRAQQRLVVLTTSGNASRFCVEAGLVAAPEPAAAPRPAARAQPRPAPRAKPRPRAPDPWASTRRAIAPITGFELARRAIRDPGADVRDILDACQSIATAQRVLAAAVRSGDAPSVEGLTMRQAAELLRDVARSRGAELSITPPGPQVPIAELQGPARRAAADALKPTTPAGG